MYVIGLDAARLLASDTDDRVVLAAVASTADDERAVGRMESALRVAWPAAVDHSTDRVDQHRRNHGKQQGVEPC